MSLVVQRHFDNVALLCAICDHLWDARVADHPDLKKIEPFDGTIVMGRTDGDASGS
jgi:hypothetical protein